jgi:hypothetical protein
MLFVRDLTCQRDIVDEGIQVTCSNKTGYVGCKQTVGFFEVIVFDGHLNRWNIFLLLGKYGQQDSQAYTCR